MTEATPAPSAGRLLMPLGLAVCLSLLGDLTLYTVLGSQHAAIGISLAAVGVMLSVNRLIRIPGNPLLGLLLDRLGRRPLFLWGMALGVISTASYGLVQGFWPFLIGRLLWGIAWTLINVGGMTMILDVSTAASRGRLSGMYNTWVLVGLGSAPLLGGFLVDRVGFQSAMGWCAGLTALGLLVALLALPETAGYRHSAVDTRPTVLPWRVSLPSGLVIAGLIYMTFQFSVEGVVLSTLNLLIEQGMGDGVRIGGMTVGLATVSGVLLGTRFLLSGMLSPWVGHLSDRYWGRLPTVLAGLVVGIVSFAMLTYGGLVLPPLWSIFLGVVLGAVSSGLALAPLAAYVGDLAPLHRLGMTVGGYATAGDIGATLGPLVAFALLPRVGLTWTYVLCGVLFAVGVVLICSERRLARRAPDEPRLSEISTL